MVYILTILLLVVRKVSLKEFDEAYTGIVLVMEPGEEFQKGGKQRSMVAALASRLTNSRRALVFCLLTGLFLNFSPPGYTRFYPGVYRSHFGREFTRLVTSDDSGNANCCYSSGSFDANAA